MHTISTVSKKTHVLTNETDNNLVSLTENSVVIINRSKDDVLKIVRNGNAVEIQFKNGDVIIIENFFNDKNDADNSIVFNDEDGKLYWAEFTDTQGQIDAIQYQLLDDIEPLLYDEFTPGLILPWLGGGAAVGGAVLAGANDSDSNKKSEDVNVPKFPIVTENNGEGIEGTGDAGSTIIITDSEGNTVSTTVNEDGTWDIKPNPLNEGEIGKIEAVDDNGNSSGQQPITGGDQTAPTAPIVTENNGEGIEGTGDAGSTIIITDSEGNTVSTTVNEDGTWDIEPNPLNEGEIGKIEAVDDNGNSSGQQPITGGDQTAPTAPIVTENNGEGIEGTGDAGSTIIITDSEGNKVSTTVNEDGTWDIEPNPLNEGEIGKIEAVDDNGNSSGEQPITGGDQTAPTAPIVTENNSEGIEGTGDAGSIIIITDSEGNTVSTTVNEDGTWDIEPNPLNEGEIGKIEAVDDNGNGSGEQPITGGDQTAPTAPIVTENNGEGIEGTGDAGSTIIITDSEGNTVSTTVNEDGTWDIEPNPLNEGEIGKIEAVDDNGNSSGEQPITGGDQTAPTAPIVTENNGEGIEGTGDAGSTIIITDSEGNTVSTTVNEDGTWDIEPNPLNEGEIGKIEAVDDNGNSSGQQPINRGDESPPKLAAELNEEGSLVTGQTEPNTWVEIRDPVTEQVIASGTADEDGYFEITLDPALTDGDKANVVAIDEAGNPSTPVELSGSKDTQAPELEAELSTDGTVVTGQTEPNTWVEIRDPVTEQVIASGTSDDNGDFSIKLDPAITDGNSVDVVAIDKAGNPSQPQTLTGDKDTLAPKDLSANLNADGDVVTGQTEAGAKVVVKDKAGNIIGEATADAEGNYSVTLSTPLTDNAQGFVTAADAAGNTIGPKTVAGGKDTIAPELEAELSTDGTVVTGQTEPNTWVEIRDPVTDEVIASGTSDDNGDFSIKLDPAITDGNSVDVVAIDKAGNDSAPVELTGSKDTQAPELEATLNPEGTLVTGETEPNTLVEIRDPVTNEVIASGTSDEDGYFEIPLDPTLTDGDKANVVAIDEAGNPSAPVELSGSKDTQAPELEATLNPEGTLVTGETEPNTLVEIRDPVTDEVIASGTSDEDGYFEIPLDPALTDGDKANVVAIDKAGNPSQPQTLTGDKDTLAPKDLSANLNADGDVVTGQTEADAKVVVKDKAGNIIGEATADAEGNYSVTLSTPLTDNAQGFVTAADAAGNTIGPKTVVGGKDTIAPELEAELSTDGTLVTGQTEPNTWVEIRDPVTEQVIASGTSDDNGDFSIKLDPAITDGNSVDVVAIDKAGNPSQPQTLTGDKDTLAPKDLSANLNADGDVVTGQTEADAKVVVKDKAGNIIGEATADAEGDYSVTLSTPLTDNAQGFVTAADAAGNTIGPKTVIGGKDTIAPELEAELNPEGTLVTGQTEPNTLVEIRDPVTEQVIASGTSDENGDFSIKLDPAITDGNSVDVVAIDEAGNDSAPVELTGSKDTQAPELEATLNPEGTLVTGETEPNTWVEIRDPVTEEVIASGTSDEDGYFEIPLDPALTDGNSVDVVAIDKAGNPSQPQKLTGDKDTLAPKDLSANLNADGDVVTGKTEAGAKVVVKDKAGNIIGEATADAEGNYSVTLSTPLTDNAQGFVTAADAAGNTIGPKTVVGGKDTIAPELEAELNPDGTVVTGQTEPNTWVEIRDPVTDEVIASGTSDEDGHFEIELSPAITDGNSVDVVAIDKAGNDSAPVELTGSKDTLAPKDLSANLNADGDVVTGQTEAGAKVVVKDKAGNIIGEATADAEGNYSVTLSTPLTDNAQGFVTASDAAGNTIGPKTVVGGKDTIAPELEAELSTDGTLVTGQTEPNTWVEIRDPVTEQVIASGTSDDNGDFSIKLDPAITDGNSVDVVAIDKAGNDSAPVELTGSKDTQAPELEATLNPEGTLVTGETEPNTLVEIRDPVTEQVIASGTSDEDGYFEITLDPALTDGDKANVVAIDEAGNPSAPVELSGSKDTQAPELEAELSTDGTLVTGQTEPNTWVEIRDPVTDEVIASGTSDEDGYFEITLDPALTDGDKANVVAIDKAGNPSQPQTLTGDKDTLAPKDLSANLNADGDVVTGKTEADAKVVVKDKAGNIIGEATADAEGNYSVTLSTPLTDNAQGFVTAADAAGNTIGPKTVAGGKDTIAPELEAELSTDGTVATGQTEPNTLVEIRDPVTDEVIASGTSDDNGDFSIKLDPAITDGNSVDVVAIDKAGNPSQPQTLTGDKDTLAPKDLSANLNADGDVVTGKTEAGAKVVVKDKAANIIGEATADAEGNYSVTLSTPLTDNAQGFVTAADAAGNTIGPKTVVGGKDTIAPELEAELNPEGTLVTGQTEPNTWVEIRDPVTEQVIASGTSDDNGDFSIKLDPAITDGNSVDVVAIDKAGNPSQPQTLTGDKDTLAPKDLSANLNADGDVVTGQTEAGAKVVVKDKAGNIIGEATADAEGNYSVTLSTPLTDNAQGFVTASDAAGNTIGPKTVVGGKDTIAPELEAELSTDGTVVTGQTEPNTWVEIRDPVTEQVIASGTSDEDGYFEIELSPALTDGNSVDVVAIDEAGNPSAPVELTGSKDTQAPELEATLNPEGTLVTGETEPNTWVEIRDPVTNEVIASGTSDEDGYFEIPLDPALTDGDKANVVAIDEAGNPSAPVELSGSKDTQAPELEATLNPEGTLVTGETEPNTWVEIRDPITDEVIASGTSDDNGDFSIKLDPAITDGNSVDVVAIDKAGNPSQPQTLTGDKDTIAPKDLSANLNADGDVVTGKTEADAKVVVKDKAGNIIGTATADAEGNYSVTLSTPLTDNAQGFVTAADAAGNTIGPKTVVGGKDTIAPELEAELNPEGTLVTGQTEPNTWVEIRDPVTEQVIASGISDDNGDFIIKLDPAITDGNSVDVVAIDKAGNDSVPVELTGSKDTLAPKDLSANLNAEGDVVTGQTEADAKVVVKDKAGNIIGEATADAEGDYSVTLSTPLTDNAQGFVTAADAAGNTIGPKTVIGGKDTIAPELEAELNPEGTLVTGQTEPNTWVEIRDPVTEQVIASGTSDEDGHFEIELSPAITDGNSVDVVAIDEAGNPSAPVELSGSKDTQAPELEATLNPEGTLVTGET
ncbi:BapA prefix-like domain-containing protein, partial [Acinetobacter sp. 187]|uniref:Ig-like domain-containing protein n=1 Tax=Acinetobacter lanii TaxID=2715163 RepID=UPI001407AB03